MAGGIFVDQPFHANPKCIIFSVVLMIAYWTLPKKNPFMLPLIFVFAYVSMAWYDYLYNCDLKKLEVYESKLYIYKRLPLQNHFCIFY